MNDPILQVRDLSCELGGKQILRDVSFDLERGGVLSVAGPNGAGKSTLIKCVAGLLNGWQGRMVLENKSRELYAAREAACIVAYVPQSDVREIPFTVAEFMLQSRYAHYRKGIPGLEDYHQVDHALKTVDMMPFKNQMMMTLSGGERQMINIAAALVQQPKLMILDEPVSFLDYRRTALVSALLRRINVEYSIAILTVLHDVNLAVAIGGRFLALKQGALMECIETEQLFERLDLLDDLYDMSFSVASGGEATDLKRYLQANIQKR